MRKLLLSISSVALMAGTHAVQASNVPDAPGGLISEITIVTSVPNQDAAVEQTNPTPAANLTQNVPLGAMNSFTIGLPTLNNESDAEASMGDLFSPITPRSSLAPARQDTPSTPVILLQPATPATASNSPLAAVGTALTALGPVQNEQIATLIRDLQQSLAQQQAEKAQLDQQIGISAVTETSADIAEIGEEATSPNRNSHSAVTPKRPGQVRSPIQVTPAKAASSKAFPGGSKAKRILQGLMDDAQTVPPLPTLPAETETVVPTAPAEAATVVPTAAAEPATVVPIAPAETETIVPTAPVEPATVAPTAPVETATVVPTAPAETATVVPTAPAETATVVPTAAAETAPVVPTAPAETETVVPTAPAETETVVPTAPAETETVAPTALVETETVAPTAPVETETVVPTAPAETATVVPTAPVETETVAPTAPVETETVVPTAPAETETVAPTAPVETETVVPTAPAETATVVPTAPVETETVAPTAPVETETVAPTAPVETATVVPTAPVETETVVPNAPAETETVVPTAPVETATVVPTAPVETATVVPTAPVETETVAPTAPAETETVAPTAPAETETVAPTAPAAETATVVPTTPAETPTLVPEVVTPAAVEPLFGPATLSLEEDLAQAGQTMTAEELGRVPEDFPAAIYAEIYADIRHHAKEHKMHPINFAKLQYGRWGHAEKWRLVSCHTSPSTKPDDFNSAQYLKNYPELIGQAASFQLEPNDFAIIQYVNWGKSEQKTYK